MFARSTLGSTATAVQVTNIATSAAAAAVPGALLAAHLIGAAAAGPIGAGIMLLGIGISALVANSGCGPTCIQASALVDQMEPQLKANLAAFLSGPRTQADQLAALANFDAGWGAVTRALSDPSLGDAGRRGISDRSRGGKWDWFAYYRDPIEQSPVAVDPIGQAASTFLSSEPGPALLIAAAAVVLLAVML